MTNADTMSGAARREGEAMPDTASGDADKRVDKLLAPAASAAAEAVARMAPHHPGFMPYPDGNPTALVEIETGLRLEAQRLLSIAQDEFARRYAAQSQGLDESSREMAAARLRRALRIDALTMAADPEGDAHVGGTHADLTMMTGGVVDDDGRVTFCDAAGRVLRKPVADWISFTAARLHHQAQAEYARKLNGSDLDQEEMQALARELRRALRMDALNILAFRFGTACDVAEAAKADAFSGPIPAPAFPGVGTVSPELLRAIEAHREARHLMLNDPDESDERTERGVARVDTLAQAIRDVPARSVADLRNKMIYLWPGNLEGEEVSPGLAATFTSFKDDVERLGASGAMVADGADAELIALSEPWDAARRLFDQRSEEQEKVERIAVASGKWPGPPPEGAGDEWRDWQGRIDEYRKQTGIYDAETASMDALDELAEIEDRVAAMPAHTLAGLQIKARIAERNSSINVDWPDGLGDGMVRDIFALSELSSEPSKTQDAAVVDFEPWNLHGRCPVPSKKEWIKLADVSLPWMRVAFCLMCQDRAALAESMTNIDKEVFDETMEGISAQRDFFSALADLADAVLCRVAIALEAQSANLASEEV